LERLSDALADRYRFERELGRGGMATVYLAADLKHHRSVAIKVLTPERTALVGAERFLREIAVTAQLDHPHILPLLDSGEAAGLLYYVMPSVEGESLRARLEREKQLPIEDALRIAREVASALSYAHGKGVVHRDIKPDNILLAAGHARVADFGIARALSAAAADRLTETGLAIGTATYMSPEQASGEPQLDGRSDIYSLGCVLYEMLVGDPPFSGASAQAVLARKSMGQIPSLQVVRETLPPAVERAIGKALARVPADRFATAAEFAKALNEPTDPRPSRPPAVAASLRRRGLRGVAVLLAMVAGAILWVWRPWSGLTNPEPLRAGALTTLAGVELYPSLSADGNTVAFSWTGPRQDNPDIYLQTVGSGAPSRLTTDPSHDYNPVWSPDGRWIAWLRRQGEGGRSEVRLIPPLGGPERTLTEIRVNGTFVAPPYLTWCPDSSCLVATDSPGEGKPAALFVVSVATGEKRQLTDPQAPASGDTNPAVSPDGRWLVFRRNASGPSTGELYRLSLGDGMAAVGEPRRLTPASLDAAYPAWIPGNKEVLFSARGGLWRLVVPGDNGPGRLPFVGEDGLMPVVAGAAAGRAPRLVYVRRFRDSNVWRVETAAPGAAASSPPVVAIASTRGDIHQQLSPDGRRVAFGSDRSGVWEIWLADPDGSNPVQLTSMSAGSTGPRWSPDGRFIAFHSNPEGQWEIFVVPVAGGPPRNLTAHPATDAFPSFSADGRWVYFNSDRAGGQSGERQIWKIPASGGDAVPVTGAVGYAGFESPDGAHLYYAESVDNTPAPLWRLAASGGAPVRVLEGVVLGNFVVGQGGIYYLDRPSGEGGDRYIDRPAGETRLRYFDFATRRSITVAGNLGSVDIGLTATADGRTILFSRVDSSVDDLMVVDGFR
jgi:serine/threonine-protein kinase